MKRSEKKNLFEFTQKDNDKKISNNNETKNVSEINLQILYSSGITLFSFLLIGFFMGTLENFLFVFIMISTILLSSFLLSRFSSEKRIEVSRRQLHRKKTIIDFTALIVVWFGSQGLYLSLYYRSILSGLFLVIIMSVAVISLFITLILSRQNGYGYNSTNLKTELFLSTLSIFLLEIGLLYVLPIKSVILHYEIMTIVIISMYLLKLYIGELLELFYTYSKSVRQVFLTILGMMFLSNFLFVNYDLAYPVPPIIQLPIEDNTILADDVELDNNFKRLADYYYDSSSIYNLDYELLHTFDDDYRIINIDDVLFVYDRLEDDYYNIYEINTDYSITYVLTTDKNPASNVFFSYNDAIYPIAIENSGKLMTYLGFTRNIDINIEDAIDLSSEDDFIIQETKEYVIIYSNYSILYINNVSKNYIYDNVDTVLYSNGYIFTYIVTGEVYIQSVESYMNNEEAVFIDSLGELDYRMNVFKFRVYEDTIYFKYTYRDNTYIKTYNKDYSVKEDIVLYDDIEPLMYQERNVWIEERDAYLIVHEGDTSYLTSYDNVAQYKVNANPTVFTNGFIVFAIVTFIISNIYLYPFVRRNK